MKLLALVFLLLNVSAATAATVLHKENVSPFRAESIEKAKKARVSDHFSPE